MVVCQVFPAGAFVKDVEVQGLFTFQLPDSTSEERLFVLTARTLK